MSDLGWSHLTLDEKRTILRGVEDGQVYGGPYHVEIQPQDACNIDCFFCATRGHRAGATLSWAALDGALDGLRGAGTHAITLAGGGEPLLHPDAERLIERIGRDFALYNLTTNGTLLDRARARALVAAGCEQVIVSLNAADAAIYARMMRTDGARFHRVVENVQVLRQERDAAGASRPLVKVQFLVYKENYRTIPETYRLARALDADGVIYNGLAYLPAELRMTPAETADMMALFEEVLREDGYRRVYIHCMEQDLSFHLRDVERRLHRGAFAWRRNLDSLAALVAGGDGSVRHALASLPALGRGRSGVRTLRQECDCCIGPWYTLTIRADGTIPVCCVLQRSTLGRLEDGPLGDTWRGAALQRVRRELRRMIARRGAWEPGHYPDVVPMCHPASTGIERCHFRSFYFTRDLPFLRRLRATIAGVRVGNRDLAG